MRDPKRIEKIIQLLRCYWLSHPDLRLGQIIGNMAPGDPYYFEDDKLEQKLISELENLSMSTR